VRVTSSGKKRYFVALIIFDFSHLYDLLFRRRVEACIFNLKRNLRTRTRYDNNVIDNTSYV